MLFLIFFPERLMTTMNRKSFKYQEILGIKWRSWSYLTCQLKTPYMEFAGLLRVGDTQDLNDFLVPPRMEFLRVLVYIHTFVSLHLHTQTIQYHCSWIHLGRRKTVIVEEKQLVKLLGEWEKTT